MLAAIFCVYTGIQIGEIDIPLTSLLFGLPLLLTEAILTWITIRYIVRLPLDQDISMKWLLGVIAVLSILAPLVLIIIAWVYPAIRGSVI